MKELPFLFCRHWRRQGAEALPRYVGVAPLWMGKLRLRGGIGGLWVTGKSFGPPARQRGRSSS